MFSSSHDVVLIKLTSYMQKSVLIVGGGISALIAAQELIKRDFHVTIFEKSDRVGGRVKTDSVDGYKLDHGFQVLLTAYPEAERYLDYSDLNLKTFSPGAFIHHGKKRDRIGDPNRDFFMLFPTLFASVGSLGDKFNMLKLKRQLQNLSEEEIFSRKETTTEEILREYGFSQKMIERFFRPFYSGIFLEKGLTTSRRMFDFIFSMFAKGFAAIPAKGMGEIPRQLAEQLPKDTIKTNTAISSINGNSVTDEDGNEYSGDAILLATEAINPLKKDYAENTEYHSTDCLYFTADSPPYHQPVISLNAGGGCVNNVSVMSAISPHYAPKDKALISVSLTGEYKSDDDKLVLKVKQELKEWYGDSVDSWTFLKRYSISYALPGQQHVSNSISKEKVKIGDKLFQAGDHLMNGSLNAAMRSGRIAAEAISDSFKEA